MNPHLLAPLALLFLLLPQPQAAATEFLNVSSSLSATDLVQTNRLARVKLASDWSTLKPYPGLVAANSTQTYHYRTYTIPASTISEGQYVQINVVEPQGAVFVSAYLDAYTPGSAPTFGLNLNYLGDVGDSTGPSAADPSKYFQVFVPSGHALVLVVNETGTTLGVNFSIQAEGFLDTEYTSWSLTYNVTSPLANVPLDPTIYELGLEVVNTTSRPVYGFRLTVPDLPRGVTLANATSPAGTNPPYVDYNIAVPVDYSVALKLQFKSESRVLPDILDNFIISPLPSTQIPGANGLAFFYPTTLPISPGVIQVNFPSAAGHVYQIQYSVDGAKWSTAAAPISALANKVQWQDSGPPVTATAPAGVRYYRVSDITQ